MHHQGTVHTDMYFVVYDNFVDNFTFFLSLLKWVPFGNDRWLWFVVTYQFCFDSV